MRQPRVQEFECLGIPLKANFFAPHDCAPAALRVPTKQLPRIREFESTALRYRGTPISRWMKSCCISLTNVIHLPSADMGDLYCMKKIGFLSFGHWTPSPQSQARSAADALLQSIDFSAVAERLGMDGASFRVHHFAQQLASPFPLLAALGAKTRKIEIGTAVIDISHANSHYMAEDAGAADLISGGRLQLGISRGSPEQVIDGWRYFGYRPIEGEDDEDMGRRRAQAFLAILLRNALAHPHP